MGIIAWALNTWAPTSIRSLWIPSQPHWHRWVRGGLGLCDLCSTALVLRYSCALALTALDNGIMTPWALENTRPISNMVPSKRRWQPVRPSYLGQADAGLLYFPWGQWCDLGLILAIFIASRRADYRQVANWRCRPASSRLTNRFCLVCQYHEPGDVYPVCTGTTDSGGNTLAAYYMGIIPPVTNIAPWTCQPVWEPSLTPTVASPHCWCTLQPWYRNVNLSALCCGGYKAQNAIDKEESEEDIANALNFNRCRYG